MEKILGSVNYMVLIMITIVILIVTIIIIFLLPMIIIVIILIIFGDNLAGLSRKRLWAKSREAGACGKSRRTQRLQSILNRMIMVFFMLMVMMMMMMLFMLMVMKMVMLFKLMVMMMMMLTLMVMMIMPKSRNWRYLHFEFMDTSMKFILMGNSHIDHISDTMVGYFWYHGAIFLVPWCNSISWGLFWLCAQRRDDRPGKQ